MQAVDFSYSRRGSRVLNGLTFSSESSRVAILGPNGAGKSTLMSILATVKRPKSGHFISGDFDSRDRANLRKFRARLGVVPQTSTAFGGMTCREFLGYVAWLRAMPAAGADTRIQEAITAVGLDDWSDRKLSTYSGGMRQRASLAQALVNNPLLLLLDEPTVSLDPAQRDAYLELLRGIPSPTTVVMTSHVVDDIAAFAEDIVVMREGRCLFYGPMSKFCSSPPEATLSGAQVKSAYLQLLTVEGADV